MKRFIAALLVPLFLLVGCGGESEPQPRETVFVEQEAPESNSSSQFSPTEEEFLFDVSNHMTAALGPIPQADVVDLGYKICGALDRGAEIDDIVSVGERNGLSYTDIIVISAAAVVNFCPQHRGSPSVSNMT